MNPRPAPPRLRGVGAALAVVAATTTLSLAGATPARAATYEVDTLSDDPLAGQTLREAIDNANVDPGIDTITFAPGLTGTIALTAQLDILHDLRIVGPGADLLTIDGGNTHRVAETTGPGVGLNIRGLTIANGSSPTSGGGLRFHGGGYLILDDVVVRGSGSDEYGGGISIADTSGAVEFTDVRITGNRAGDLGGGLAGDSIGGDVTFERVVIDGNESSGFGIGGVGLGDVGNVAFDTVTIRDNVAAGGFGGLYVDATGTGTFTDLAVNDNTASGSAHGGMGLTFDGAVSVDGLELTGNEALDPDKGTYGGGLIRATSSTLTISDAVVEDNAATAVGGLAALGKVGLDISDAAISRNSASTSATGLIGTAESAIDLKGLTIEANAGGGTSAAILVGENDVSVAESTIAGNTSTGVGGALRVETTDGTLRVVNSTVSGNQVGNGAIGVDDTALSIEHSTVVDNAASGDAGAVALGGASSVRYDHSIVAGNTGNVFDDVPETLAGAEYSLIGDAAGVPVPAATNIIGVDPMLGELADNGGPTRTHLPDDDSPAIDAGDPGVVAPATDQRGQSREVGTIDIGSVERNPSDPSPLPEVWVPVDPARILETRPGIETIDGEFQGIGRRPADGTVAVDVAGRAGVPADARGVIVNMTAVRPEFRGFATIHACLPQRPNTSSLNYTRDVNLGNEIIADLDDQGRICVYTEVATDLTLDVVGYIPADSPYTSLTPARFADTRDDATTFDGAIAGGGKPAAGDVLTIPVAGRGDVPADAAAVVMYVAAVTPEATGYVTAYGCAQAMPNASSLNFAAGINRGNEIIVRPDPDGNICLATASAAHLTADVVGYLPAATDYTPLPTGARLLDTRGDGTTIDGESQGLGRLTGGSTITVQVAGRGGIPDTAATAVVNMTAVRAAGVGFATAYNCDGEPPLASSLNYVAGVNGGNEIVVGLGDTGAMCVFVDTGTHLTIDVAGATTPG